MSQQDWQTPPDFFALLDREFDGFDVDLAATRDNTLANTYVSGPCAGADCDSCGIHIRGLCDDVIFCNPPYDNPRPWVEQFSRLATNEGNTVVAILQAQTGSRWFKLAESTANEIRLLHGRIQFIDPTNTRGGRNRFDSIVAVWRPGIVRRPATVWVWDWRPELEAAGNG